MAVAVVLVVATLVVLACAAMVLVSTIVVLRIAAIAFVGCRCPAAVFVIDRVTHSAMVSSATIIYKAMLAPAVLVTPT